MPEERRGRLGAGDAGAATGALEPVTAPEAAAVGATGAAMLGAAGAGATAGALGAGVLGESVEGDAGKGLGADGSSRLMTRIGLPEGAIAATSGPAAAETGFVGGIFP